MDVDSFYTILGKTNSTGMITVNYGYARYGTSTDPVAQAAHMAADWVRYDNGRSKFWEIGNEVFEMIAGADRNSRPRLRQSPAQSAAACLDTTDQFGIRARLRPVLDGNRRGPASRAGVKKLRQLGCLGHIIRPAR